jgi:methyl-accepting chemotaxis protein
MELSKDSEEMDTNQRNNSAKFVIPRLQMKIIINVLFATLGIFFLSYLLVDYLRTHQIQDLLDATTLNENEKNKIVTALDISTVYWASLCGLFAIMLTSFAVMLSHKIAGPIYHISRVLNEYAEGNSKSRICLRKGDEFIMLEDLINRLIESNEKYKNIAETRATAATSNTKVS